jgi:hypothetical protein
MAILQVFYTGQLLQIQVLGLRLKLTVQECAKEKHCVTIAAKSPQEKGKKINLLANGVY